MTNIQAVIFDWGGVLIEDPAPGLVSYFAKVLGVGEDEYRQSYNLFMDVFIPAGLPNGSSGRI